MNLVDPLELEPATCRCGEKGVFVLRIAAPLFGVLYKWRCSTCGDVWLTR